MGIIIWYLELGRIEPYFDAALMSHHHALTREGHLMALGQVL